MRDWTPPGSFEDALELVLPHGSLTFPSFSNDRGTLTIRDWLERIWLHGFITGNHDLAEKLTEGSLRRFNEGKVSVLEHEVLLEELDRLMAQDSTLSRSLRYHRTLEEDTPEVGDA